MDIAQTLSFLAIATVAAYVQTLTGFAFGLIVMGSVGLSGVMPLPDAAVVVSVLTLANASQMLVHGWRHVMRRELLLVTLGSLPALAVGYAVLDHLAGNGIALLRVLLGAVILVSAVQLVRPPPPERELSSRRSFLFFGSLSGLMGGLFSTSGPPLVHHFYRQPLDTATVRETLVTVFAVNALVRLLLVGANGSFPPSEDWPAFLALPLVVAGTRLARRLPPPLSPRGFRAVVFVLLALSGLALALPPLAR